MKNNNDYTLFSQYFLKLAQLSSKPGTWKVLFLLGGKLVHGNFVSMDIRTICEETKLSKKSVIDALNELVKCNIVIKTKFANDNRKNEYCIFNYFCRT